jgi:protein-L-isoaspartate(D-aspartate) O-methyltransferase
MPQAHQEARETMVRTQLERRDITEAGVLAAMRSVPRHYFVPKSLQNRAYEDRPLPIGAGQTISQPYIVAFMMQALQLENPAEASVLEIGTGLGYQAAVLSRYVGQVYTVERVPELAEQARRRFEALGYENIALRVGDGTLGWPDYAPFAGIISAAAAPQVPEPWLKQLAPSGKMVLPVGKRRRQKLLRVTAAATGFQREVLLPVAFVPLIGDYGWVSAEEAE